jgi:hypothetical protein
MSLQREDCIHPFDTGFIPKISDDRDAIIVTHSSPLISAVTRVRRRRISHLGRFVHWRRRKH